MRRILCTLIAFISLNSFAALNEEQKEIVLTEIDNICGDTWCESDYNYSFDSIEQTDNDTILKFTQIEELHDHSEKVQKSCVLKDFTEFSQMVEVTQNSVGERFYNLTESFYSSLNKCF